MSIIIAIRKKCNTIDTINDEMRDERVQPDTSINIPLVKNDNTVAELISAIETDMLVDGIGGRTWDGSMLLAYYMTQHISSFNDKCVIELGAGTGILSKLASNMKAKRVLCTDGVNDLVEKNIIPDQILTTEELKWGCNEENDILRRHGYIDNESPDIILGAEICILRKQQEKLVHTLSNLMGLNTLAFVTFDSLPPPNNNTAEVEFIERMKERKFIYRLVCVGDLNWSSTNIKSDDILEELQLYNYLSFENNKQNSEKVVDNDFNSQHILAFYHMDSICQFH